MAARNLSRGDPTERHLEPATGAHDIGVAQKTAWFNRHRIREACTLHRYRQFKGLVEADETYVRGTEQNKRARRKLHTARGGVGEPVGTGLRDSATGHARAEIIESGDSFTLKSFIRAFIEKGKTVYTDDASSCKGLPSHHEVVIRSRGDVHTNNIEIFWAVVTRAHKGTLHHISEKHLIRYVAQFDRKQNMRSAGIV